MKSTLDKILLTLLMLIVVVLAFVVFGLAFSLISADSALAFVVNLQGGLLKIIFASLVALLLLVGAFRIMIVFCSAASEDSLPKTAPSSVVVSQGEAGTLHVSLSAIDAMAKRYCQANEKIRSCQTTILPADDGSIALKLRITLKNDAHIPEVTENLQSDLRRHIEEGAGLKVTNVDILVVSKTGPLK